MFIDVCSTSGDNSWIRKKRRKHLAIPDPEGVTETTAAHSCITTKLIPCDVTVVLKEAPVLFNLAVKVRVALPVPLIGLTVNQFPQS